MSRRRPHRRSIGHGWRPRACLERGRPDFFFFLFGLAGSCVMTHNLPDRRMPSQGETMAGVYKKLAMPSAFVNAIASYLFWRFVYSLLHYTLNFEIYPISLLHLTQAGPSSHRNLPRRLTQLAIKRSYSSQVLDSQEIKIQTTRLL